MIAFSVNTGPLELLVLGAACIGLLVVAAAVVVLAVHLARRRKGMAPEGGAEPRAATPPAAPRRCAQCGTPVPADAPLGQCPRCMLKAGVDSRQETQPSPSAAEGGPSATRFVPPAPADLAPHFPNLEILELLGQGGMGAVYKARQPGLDRLVALKVLPPGIGSGAAFAERFKREARSLARLNHPNIVAVYDFGEAAGLYYFLMEYVDGANLRQMERTERLAPREALGIVVQVCEALQFAHDEGIVHRDIKPENILLDKKGRVKIADFGLAKLLGRTPADFTLTQPQQVMGTVHYMAPEQLEHPAEVDQRADIYSLGVVFYEMLTGELPLGRFAPPSQKFQVDVRLDEVVLKALEKEPSRRYQHASEVKTDVEEISRGPQAPAATATGDLEPKVIEKYRTGGKPAAIGVYRDETGAGLREAKEAVEAIARKHGFPETPFPLEKRLVYIAVAFAIALPVMIAILVLMYCLDLSPIISTPLWWAFLIVVILVNVRKIKTFCRLRGIPQLGRWLALFLFIFFAGLPLLIFVLELLFNPAPILNYFYSELGIKPGRHDAVLTQIVSLALLLGTVVWLVAFLVRSRSKRKQARAAKGRGAGGPAVTQDAAPKEPPPPEQPGTAQGGLPPQAAAQRPGKGRRTRTAWIVAGIIVGALLLLAVPIVLVGLAVYALVGRVDFRPDMGPAEPPDAAAVLPESEGPAVTRSYWGHYSGGPSSNPEENPEWKGVITKTGVEVDGAISSTSSGEGSLKVVADAPTVVRLFEHGPTAYLYTAGPYDVDNSRLTYQAKLRTWGLQGQAYLEMRCHFPGGEEFVSRGLDKPLSGTTDWTSVETSFVVKGAREPDNVQLNLVIDGKGTVWIDDVGLTLRPPSAKRGG